MTSGRDEHRAGGAQMSVPRTSGLTIGKQCPVALVVTGKGRYRAREVGK